MPEREKGFVLIAVIVVVVIFAITAMAVLTLAQQEVTLSRVDEDKAAAFYLAEAGLAKMQEKLQKPFKDDINSAIEESFETGSFKVELDTSKNPCYVTAVGTSGNVNEKVRVQVTFLAPPLEHAVYAMNKDESDWDFQLRGKGNPVSSGFSGTEKGGKDMINGDIFVNGDVYLFEESSVNPAPPPNTWESKGDVGATGDIHVQDSADISGDANPHSEHPDLVDLEAMDYVHNNTHNVAQIFYDAGVSSGYLPSDNELRNVFVKNPGDRSEECSSTTGDDYFFEPSTGFIAGSDKTAETPLHAGQDRIYYIDGDLWVHSKNDTYGFNMDGKATIVVTGNIHLCDNLAYADDQSMLGLVALGKYDDSGELISGGNIFFGDPRFGTLYIASGMMFAAKDFLYNTDSISRKASEPTTGFTVNGNFAAMGDVSVDRDWYTAGTGFPSTAKPARYNPNTGHWEDAETGVTLNSTQVNSIRHYQMIVNYDDRVRNVDTQPPGLPRGGTKIFAGFSNWQQL
jgi:type II secretory pathway pseudopilin PulG